MGAVLPVRRVDIHQSQISFIDQRRSLKGIAGLLVFHAATSNPMHLGVDDRHQPAQRAGSPAAQAFRQRVISPVSVIARLISKNCFRPL